MHQVIKAISEGLKEAGNLATLLVIPPGILIYESCACPNIIYLSAPLSGVTSPFLLFKAAGMLSVRVKNLTELLFHILFRSEAIPGAV